MVLHAALTIDREEIKKRIRKVIIALREKGIRVEHIAVDMGLSSSTILNWKSGLRVPKIHTIQRLEQLSGMRIL